VAVGFISGGKWNHQAETTDNIVESGIQQHKLNQTKP
jgi:hypothetical protein